MTFENELIGCILNFNPNVEIIHTGLVGKAALVRDKNILFHLLPIPYVGIKDLSPTYFQEKSLEYASRGIQLVHLWQDVWVAKQAIVRSRIAVFTGSYERIFARQTEVRRITKDVASIFFATNHLQGFVNGRYHYGLYYDGRLVTAASFSAGRKMTRNSTTVRSFELLRFANVLHHRVTGGLGKLIARFIKDVNPDDIMTYADLDWGDGKSYRSLNFEMISITPPQNFWTHPDEMIRYYPNRLPQQLTDEFQQQKKNVVMDDFLKDKGYNSVYNAGNLKFLLDAKKTLLL